MRIRPCYGCKTDFPYQEDLAVYQATGLGRYGVAIPECTVAFNQVLAKEQQWARHSPIQRLLIDAYAVQHPPYYEIQKKLGIDQRLINASAQSVAIHLIALYLAFENRVPLQDISNRLAHILQSGIKLELLTLEPPTTLGNVTIADIQKISHGEEYEKMVQQWAYAAWHAWKQYHELIKKLAEADYSRQSSLTGEIFKKS